MMSCLLESGESAKVSRLLDEALECAPRSTSLKLKWVTVAMLYVVCWLMSTRLTWSSK